MSDLPRLPTGFEFGTSTASYQIEGAVTADGRGPSVWDTFTAESGRVKDGTTGELACDHYHRYPEDVALMRRLGAQGARFSLSWSRVLPEGAGRVNPAGLDFYDRLVDEICAADVAPMATLFHWDLPQALEDTGGWLQRETAERFADYAAVVAERLGDRVAKWVPVNEPNVVTMLGYALGVHAPGRTMLFDALPVAHHLLLGHGLAVRALRETVSAQIGTATNHTPVWASSDDEEDRAAAELYDTLWNRLFADPVLLGHYPDGFVESMPIREGDLQTIAQPLDFYGFNYYNPTSISAPVPGARVASAGGEVNLPDGLPFAMQDIPGYPKTDFGWPVVPDGLREQIMQLVERYPDIPPLYVTEQGCSYGMGPDEQGEVDDQPRIDYYDAHLRAVADAIGQGADVRGYYAWSLLDNFEWAEGLTQRFGLVHVDFETQQRTTKRSFDWFAQVVQASR